MKGMSDKLRGVIVPMVTPFDENEALDERAMRELSRWLIARGVTGLYPESGCGEVWKLSFQERLRIIEVVGEEAKGKALFIPGTGGGSTRETIALTQHARDNGADACVVWPPYFAGAQYSDDAILHHFKTVAMIQGWDTMFLASLAIGAPAGTMSSANVCPELLLAMMDDLGKGQTQTAREKHEKLIALVCSRAWVEDQFQSMKACLAMLGVPAGRVRKPWFALPFSDAQKEELAGALRNMNLIK